MSCYNWERGTIIIPKDQWPNFRTKLITAWNESQTALFTQAVEAHNLASEKAKGKRGTNRQNEILSAIASYCKGTYNSSGWYGGNDPELFHSIRELILSLESNKSYILVSPKKSSLKIYPTSKSATIDLPDATITLDNDSHSITWNVEENNRAVEHARSHPIAKKLFSLLNLVEWKRGSGGKIIGNDEYNRDSEYEGGGANYVTDNYGPSVKTSEGKSSKKNLPPWW